MQIHVLRDGEKFGPYSEEEVRQYLNQGTLLPTDLAWHEGIDNWIALNELVSGRKSKTPPPPPSRQLPSVKSSFRRKRPIVIYPFIGLILLIILYIASPYYEVYSLRSALIKGDQDQLESAIDFPSVRQSLKEQFKATVAKMVIQGTDDNAMAGMASLVAPTMIDNAVDLYATPSAIAAFVNKSNGNAITTLPENELPASHFLSLSDKLIKHESFESPDSFVIDIDIAKLCFQFYGLRWKLNKIEFNTNFDLLPDGSYLNFIK